MEVAWNLYLAFGLMMITNELLDLKFSMEINYKQTNFELNACKEKNCKNAAIVWNFEVVPDKFNVDKICT